MMNIQRGLSSQLRHCFGTQALNVRIALKDPLTHQRMDRHLDRYGHLFRAFVMKRRILRSQIWPKIHIIDPVPESEQPHLAYQGLSSMKKSMQDEMMVAIAKNDPSKINSSFIISIFSEDHFKQMMDQYLSKILVCGKAPSSERSAQQQLVQKKTKQLHWMFYFGQQNSPLERQLQQAYLVAKQYKYGRLQAMKKYNKGELLECTWTQQNQRILEQKRNWFVIDTNLSDINFRTYFEPLNLKYRLAARTKYQQLHNAWTWADRLQFKWFTSKYYDETNTKYFEWVMEKMFVRIINHIRSLEFTTCLNIPHDYMIQAQMVQIHFWLVMDRLRKIGSHGSTVLARRINLAMNLQIARSARSVNLKKSNLLAASLERMLEMNSNILEIHFNKSDLTKDNHYKGIDAMVWSIAFAQKIHRYADEVYLMGEYIVQNFNHMQRHSEEDLMNGIIEFDPYLINPNYRQIIQRINPPLSPAQFQKQFNSNTAKKDYYYSKVQTEIQETMPLEKKYEASKVDTSFSMNQFLQPFRKMSVKYFSLKTMDHFNKMEQTKKQNQQFDKKGTWRSQKDEVDNINQQFTSIKQLKNHRRKLNAEQNERK